MQLDKRRTAQKLIDQGISIIPVGLDKKPIAPWTLFQSAYATPDNLLAWFPTGQTDLNIGIVCGSISKLVVVDCDGADGAQWVSEHLPATPLQVRTARGVHHYYRHPGVSVRNKIRIRANGSTLSVDIRADGGYVLAPGSTHPSGTTYELIGRWPASIDELPTFDPRWVEDAANKRATANARKTQPSERSSVSLDRDSLVARARAYVSKVPGGIEGQAGDHRTFTLACTLVRGFDLDDAKAFSVLSEWNQTCEPPWTDRELQTKIAGARKYGDEPIGGRIEPVTGNTTIENTDSETANHVDLNAGVRLDDFLAYMPMHKYIFVPARELWPASSVNARIPPVRLVNGDGNPVLDENGKPRKLSANRWLDEHRPVEQMTWTPGMPTVIQDRLFSDGGWIVRPNCGTFNLYRPPTIQRGDSGRAERWVEHVRRVYPDYADHIVAWLAHRVQRPHEKLNHALVLGGPQGIGKDTLLEPVKAAVGPWNFIEVSPTHLLGGFNGFVKSVVLRISEARDLGDVNRFTFYDHLKTYTAAPPDVLRVNEKHLREYAVFNVTGVILTTNHRTGGLYLPADDRRHYVTWSHLTKEDFDSDYWSRLWDWYEREGTRHVAAYLNAYDLSGFNPKAPPPQTAAFRDIVDANRAPEDAELTDAIESLGMPDAVTLDEIVAKVPCDFAIWLRERKNRKQIPHRLEDVGYTAVRNDGAKDGLWTIKGRRQVVYARQELPPRDRLKAAGRYQ